MADEQRPQDPAPPDQQEASTRLTDLQTQFEQLQVDIVVFQLDDDRYLVVRPGRSTSC